MVKHLILWGKAIRSKLTAATAAVLCALALSAALPYSAVLLAGNISPDDQAALDRTKRQIEEVNERTLELANEQKRIAAQQQDVLGEMKRLTGLIVELEEEIALLQAQIGAKEIEIEVLSGNIVVKTGEVNQRTDYLNDRLVQIYVEGDITLLDVLFESTSLTDFLTRYDMLSRVVDNDIYLLTELKFAKAELEAEKAELEFIKAELEAEKAERQLKQDDLSAQWDKQNQMSRQLEEDKILAEQAEDELEKLTEELKKFVAEIQAKYKSQYMGSGTMGWPVPGHTRISSYYGYRIHPIYNVRKFHSGIDIPAPRGTPTVACETGTVIMATTYGGYGKTVILDHGGGVASQYSHLHTIDVRVGDVVLKGGKVGGVGTTGLSTGNHLHFQIMIDGNSVDPINHKTYFVNPK